MLLAQGSTEHPQDLTLQIPLWLERALRLVEEHSVPAIVTELKTLDMRQTKPGFHLAIVGNLSRGKSTLINRLLGQQLLPARAIATTATFNSLVATTVVYLLTVFDKRGTKLARETTACLHTQKERGLTMKLYIEKRSEELSTCTPGLVLDKRVLAVGACSCCFFIGFCTCSCTSGMATPLSSVEEA